MVVGSAFRRVSFLSYDLSTATAPVTGPLLRLEVTDYFNANSGIPVVLPVTLYDYTGGDDADLKLSQSGSAAQTMFDDLSSGNVYGTQTFDELLIPSGSIVDISLSAAAIADINYFPDPKRVTEATAGQTTPQPDGVSFAVYAPWSSPERDDAAATAEACTLEAMGVKQM